MNLAKHIDHTILKPEATTEEIRQFCREAKEFGFASVCVNACNAALVSKELEGSNVKTCVVVGFPLGATTKEVKAYETKQAIENGTNEIDTVINAVALKEKNMS